MKSESNPVININTGECEYNEGFKIGTTTKEDGGAEAGAKKELNKDYNVVGSNCAKMVQSALVGAGQKDGSPSIASKFASYMLSLIAGVANDKSLNTIYDRIKDQNDGSIVY